MPTPGLSIMHIRCGVLETVKRGDNQRKFEGFMYLSFR